MSEPDYLKLILKSRVYDVCKETPVTAAHGLSEKLGCKVLLKREDLQPVFSFKLRGAYNMISQLSDEEKWKGVIACSAGNHAQGVAFSANYLNIPATIVMPLATPSIKHSNVSRLGGKVVLHGDDFDSAKAHCKALCEQHGLTDIPPFDHPHVIAGQGTIGMEILRQASDNLKAIFICVGGGGLIAGVGAYIKRIQPDVKIIAVETYDACALKQSLIKGERVTLPEVGLFADGAAVKLCGEETFRLCRKYVDGVVLVNTDEICAAIKDVFEATRSVVEPAGALSVAGLKKYCSDPSQIWWNEDSDGAKANGVSKDIVINETDEYLSILSGANMNFDRLRFVAERAMLGEGTEVFMVVTIPDIPGAFEKLHEIILPRAVTEFSYRKKSSTDNEHANIFVSFSVKDRQAEIADVLEKLENAGMSGVDVSDNELAKTHARYLVGGQPDVPNERLFRFEFPERPNALKNFLGGVQTKWNITLFHYRNNGSDIGKILTALDVPEKDNQALQEFLDKLKYPYVEETDNVVYKQFMR
ncbi:Threonine dehydratase [Yarrowia sp. B02]|nr:Threonine dehydratase [Yarrowia sp. B02]